MVYLLLYGFKISYAHTHTANNNVIISIINYSPNAGKKISLKFNLFKEFVLIWHSSSNSRRRSHNPPHLDLIIMQQIKQKNN